MKLFGKEFYIDKEVIQDIVLRFKLKRNKSLNKFLKEVKFYKDNSIDSYKIHRKYNI